jgi:uncharacterized protein (TIGR02099 family)
VLSAVSVQSLWRLGFEQLLVQGPVLDIRRTASGRLQIAGIDVSDMSPQQGSSPLLDWFFSQGEVAIRGGEVRWSDETRPGTATLTLQDLDLVVRNPGRQHLMRLDATPPANWGHRFTLSAQLRQPFWITDASLWREWSGTLYGEFARVDLQRLHEYVDLSKELGLEVRQGDGALRLWADVQRGAISGITSDLALNTVAVRLGQRAPLALEAVQGRIDFQHEGRSWTFASQNLAFRTPDGKAWPGGNVRYQHTLDDSGTPVAGQIVADRLDLGLLRQLSSHLPLWQNAEHWLGKVEPTGMLESLEMRWQPGEWTARGQVRQLSLAAGPLLPATVDGNGHPHQPLSRPGVSGADIVFDATQAGGNATLNLRGGTLQFPGIFAEPQLSFDTLEAQASWKTSGDDISVQLSQLRFANPDAQGEAKGSWRTGDPTSSPSGSRFPGVLDLEATVRRANGARVSRYLPQGIPEDVRDYIRTAVQKGDARDAKFLVKGDLWDFPFERNGSGVFDVRAKLAGVQFNYVPAPLLPANSLPWPTIEEMSAELHIDRTALHITQAGGRVSGMPQLRASQAEAHIANFLDAQPHLQVTAQVTGPASDALTFVNRSPLLDLTGKALQRAAITGNADVRFQLDLPLHDANATQVKGTVRFARNDLRVTPETPWLENATGLLQFNEHGFQLSPASARVLGGDLRFTGAMKNGPGQDGSIQFQGQGTLSAEGMRNARDATWLKSLGQRLSGSTGYQIRLGFTPDGTELLIESSLMGLASNLPEPLAKEAQQVLPLKLEIRPMPRGQTATAASDRVTLELGSGNVPVFSARYEREHEGNDTRVLRGALALRAERPPLPATGVQAQLNLGDFEVDAWEAAFPGSNDGPATDTRAYWPTSFGLEARSLRQGGRSFHDVVVGGSRVQDTWRFNANARELNGYVEYRPTLDATPGRVYARLARLTLPPAARNDVEQFLQEPPTQVPALDVVVDAFELNNRPLGRLEIQAINRNAAQSAREVTNEWRLTRLNLSVPEAQLEATGNWAATGSSAQRRTALTLRLNIDDSGALLTRFGMPGVVRGGKGALQGTLGWIGSPMSPHYPSMGGSLSVDLQRGQFLKADPGLAKLLGVLSLQALPRRLTLDFRDVFSEGFAFDFVRGDARIEQGVIATNNLQMKGVNAAVLLEGSADIARETQDITAVVIPEINAGTASLVATAINPAVGLGTFLAQFLLGKPLQAAATQHFHITGSWTDPHIEKVNARNIVTDTPATQKESGQP